MRRKTNPEIVAELRTLLTDGARATMSDTELEKTKEWRAKLWRLATEIEDRMDPLTAMAKGRVNYTEGP